MSGQNWGAGLRATTASRACATGSAAPTSGVSARASGAPTRPIQIVSAYVLSRFRESEEDVRRLIEHAADEAERLVDQIVAGERRPDGRGDRLSLAVYSVDDAGVALLQLDRPDARNAINTQMLEELLEHLAAARADDAVRALVLSSTDHMGLSAGADVREELDEAGKVRRMELFAQLYDELTGFPKPTVAACHGACVGGGAEIAVACDLRVGEATSGCASPGRRSASRWDRRGSSPSAGSRSPSTCC